LSSMPSMARLRPTNRQPMKCSAVDDAIMAKQKDLHETWQALSSKRAERADARAKLPPPDQGTQFVTMVFGGMLPSPTQTQDNAVRSEMAKMASTIEQIQQLRGERAAERAIIKEREDARDSFLKLCKSGPLNGVGASEDLQKEVLEAAKNLAELNPTPKQATSPLLDGSWELAFTTNEGPSAGKLGPFVGEVVQEVEAAGAVYRNKLLLFGGLIQAVLSATWNVLEEDRWEVIFQDIVFSVFGVEVWSKEFGAGRDADLDTLNSLADKDYQGSNTNGGFWDFSYTDKEVRVLYTTGVGKDPTKRSLFVLSRAKQ